MSETGVRRIAVRCEKHGLHYNPELHDGCARCRRERGEAPAVAPGASAAAASSGSWGRAFAVAAILIALSTLALFASHHAVVALFADLPFTPQ